MKFKYWMDNSIKEMPLSAALEYEVSSQDSQRGVVEDCQLQIRVLTNLLGKMADKLSPSDQLAIAKDLFYWKPVE